MLFNEITRKLVLIFTYETDFCNDTKWQNIVPWVTPLCLFGLAVKLFSFDASQILRDASSERLNAYKIFIVSQCNDIYRE